MLVKTGLLIVSNPTQISKVLANVQKQVNKTLYIQLLSALTDPFGSYYPSVFNSWPTFSQTIRKIYSQAASECEHLDVRVLLSGLKYKNISSINTLCPIDLVIFDKKHSDSDIESFMQGHIGNVNKGCGFITIDTGLTQDPVVNSDMNDGKIYKHSVLGGTFDRLHIAHKLLLTELALRSSQKITVGVTEESMLVSKILWELVEPIEKRVIEVENFLKEICPELDIHVVPISDPLGPTQHDPTMDLLVVSAETLRGGNKVNEVRTSKGLPEVEVLSIELLDEPHPNQNEEAKISSSTGRIRLLGTLLKPVHSSLPKKPYIIGLTGGIASGKTNVAKKLYRLGAEIINCDLLAHELYKPGKPCHKLIVEEFGDKVLEENGEINRKVLGGIVFGDPKQLAKLNSLVWPAIAEEVSNIIKATSSEVVVIEAAVLLTAGWQHLCHEVWTTLIPKEEAIKRLKNRNQLNEEQAAARVNSQENNKYYVNQANVVLCSLWQFEYTDQQVIKAWDLLQKRLSS